jgi:hypothetical protein
MNVSKYISSLPFDRQALLTTLHDTIMINDSGVCAFVKPMMGKEMILYEERSYMKYGLASAKNYMSLQCLTIIAATQFFVILLPEISKCI